MTDETPWGDRPTRRTFIKRAGGAAAALSIPGLLAACGNTAPVASGGGGASSGASSGSSSASAADQGPGGLALARPDHPLTLPIYADNKPIASGMKPEAGPLQLYNWIEYINPAVVKAFEKKYRVKVQISTFNTIDEAVAKLDSGAVQFDVFVPELVYLEQLVVGKILQPINLSYVPNLKANVWPSLNNPWYDAAPATPSRTRSIRPGSAGAPTSSRASTRPSCPTRGRRCGPRVPRSAARSGYSTTSMRD